MTLNLVLSQEWMSEHDGNLPTTDELENVWDLPVVTDASSAEEKAKFAKKVNLLTWCLDVFLPKAVGLEF